jgi:hypothetical protein
MSILKSFFEDLNQEESKFIPALAGDNLGLLMRCAINELDWYNYNYSRTHEPNDEQREQLYILQLGVARIIKIILESRESFDVPVVTTTRKPDLTMKVLSLASGIGVIQHGRRVAQTIASGVGEIKKIGKTKYKIVLPKDIEDDDFHERAVLEHYNRESRRRFADIFHHEKFQEVEKEVDQKLGELVYPFMDHYIGYGADPILDNYFFGLASHEISLQEGYDTYHYAIEFGGIRIQHYMLALKFLVSHSIRHERFAEALVRKCPEIKLENILTISADIGPFVESIRDAVNYFGSAYEGFEAIGVDKANQIFNVLTYGRENLNLIDPPGSPYPLSIKCSESGAIRALFGAHSEPVRYLLESLRFHFPKDYDKNQAIREASLQRAVRRVIDEAFNDIEYLENVKMRLNGQVLSDIDLVALERSTGTIVFFQLKHQELYGAEIHSKSIRNDRLKDQARDWMHAVGVWIYESGIEGVLKALQRPKSWSKNARIFQVVISRHYAYALKGIVAGEGSSFANWPQFFNAAKLAQKNHKSPTLTDLLLILQETQQEAEKVTHLPEPSTKWKVHELEFLITQEHSSCT